MECVLRLFKIAFVNERSSRQMRQKQRRIKFHASVFLVGQIYIILCGVFLCEYFTVVSRIF